MTMEIVCVCVCDEANIDTKETTNELNTCT